MADNATPELPKVPTKDDLKKLDQVQFEWVKMSSKTHITRSS